MALTGAGGGIVECCAPALLLVLAPSLFGLELDTDDAPLLLLAWIVGGCWPAGAVGRRLYAVCEELRCTTCPLDCCGDG